MVLPVLMLIQDDVREECDKNEGDEVCFDDDAYQSVRHYGCHGI